MVVRINARNDTACAVTEQEHRYPRIFRFRASDKRRHVVRIVLKHIDLEALTVRTPPPAQIDCVSLQTVCDRLLANPQRLPALRIKSGNDDDHPARFPFKLPRAGKNFQSPDSFKS